MNAMYDAAVNELIEGTLDLVHDVLWVRGFNWVGYDSSLDSMADVTPIASLADQPLLDRQVYARSMLASDVTFPTLYEGDTLRMLIVFREAVTPGAPELPVAYIDTRPDRMQINVNGNGGPVTVSWANGIVLSL